MLPAGPLHRMRIGSPSAALASSLSDSVARAASLPAPAPRNRRRSIAFARFERRAPVALRQVIHVASLGLRACRQQQLVRALPPVTGGERHQPFTHLAPRRLSRSCVELTEDLQDRAGRAANEGEVVVDRG